MKNIIGKSYIPSDNSYAVNITTSTKYPSENENLYLVGTFNSNNKICTILTNPFKPSINTGFDEITNEDYFIIVQYNNTTHMVLFYESNIIN